MALVASAPRARAANDPKLVWKTLETEHFRINYYSTEDEVAQHVATLAEAIHARLVPAVGWAPSEKTEIVLNDQTDSANGSASALPYNTMRLNVTAPDDMSPLGDVDDWYLELVTHEYTHILHTDHIEGIPALVNKILGKTLAPNQVQPHWLLEGLAVFEESARTSGGRLRSSMWNMWMRADVLEDYVATLDVFSNVPRRWPQGNIWYLYGSFFMQWIAETYGEQAIRAMIDDYAYQVIPYSINRSIRRATGRTYEELYASWVDSMQRSFGEQANAIRARGLREGTRLTHTGNTVEHPRWIPASAWPEHAGDLLYYVDDGHTRTGQWALPLVRDAGGHVVGAREKDRELMIRVAGPGGSSFMPDGAVAFSSSDVYDNLFYFDDLFELPAHQTSTSGMEGRRQRWSEGWRALDPSVSPDGRRVVFTTNHRGTTYLMMADVVPAPHQAGVHALANVRRLVDAAPFDQAFTPRWSPDNRHVTYSAWQRGGYRDVRIVDTQDRLGGRRHPRPRDRRRPGVLGRRTLALLSLRSHRRFEHLRIRGRHGAAQAGHQRHQRRVPAGALARRKVARVRGLHARRLRRIRHCARSRRRGSTRCPTRSLARRRPPNRPRRPSRPRRTTRSSRCDRATTRCRSRRATSARRASSRPAAATSRASTPSPFKR